MRVEHTGTWWSTLRERQSKRSAEEVDGLEQNSTARLQLSRLQTPTFPDGKHYYTNFSQQTKDVSATLAKARKDNSRPSALTRQASASVTGWHAHA
ncbi:hypothetical protein C0Q70_14780 [Pomacea canaliculata]|uniref:Uncharacterized protein n=1 Tax=Pomacea canaliculata TaxID=400727 RepID=A0A2T7NT12_POMCA|nr:hypothetical protein C0Q70_14780 [Pomacea canaliculata]